jgi:hypothetical protein
MTTEHQREQEERRRILLEGTTMQQFAQSQADEINQGRFAATGVPNVIGAKPGVAQMYPAASAAHQVDLPKEEPLGFAIDEMPFENSAGASPVEDAEPFIHSPAQQTGAPAGAAASLENLPSRDEASDAGASLSHKDEDHA